MKTNKKNVFVAFSVLALGVAACSVMAGKGLFKSINAAECEHEHVEHYKVYPTTSLGGRIEHWACCECGQAWYDEAKTKPVANRNDLDVAANTAATEITATDVDEGDLISTIYGESDKTKGLDQTNWGAEGTACKSTGDWKFYNVDGVNALKVSAVGLTDAQRELQHNCNNGGFGEFRFKKSFEQAQYVSFDYKLYDLNTETTDIGGNQVHFVAQQYDGSNYVNSNPIDLVYDNAWHRAVVSFAAPRDITYLPMKFFHFDGEFYIANLQISSTEPSAVVNDYDFSTSAHILDFANPTNAKYSLAKGTTENYLKVEKGNESGSTYLNFVKPLKSGQTVSFVVSYVTSDANYNSGGQFTFLAHRGNGYSAVGDSVAFGNAPWDGGWDSNKIKVDLTLTQDCASATMQFVFNNDANAYYMIHEVIVKNDGSFIDFSHPADEFAIIHKRNVGTSVVDDPNGAYLKVEKTASGTNSIGILKHMTAGTKVYIKLAYISDDLTFVNGVNQFTVIASKPNNGYTGANGCDSVFGSAPWDGGWNGNETVLEFTTDAEASGIFVQFVFNNVANSYFKVLGISYGERTTMTFNGRGDTVLAADANNVKTSYSSGDKALMVENAGSGTRSVTFFNHMASGKTVNVTVSYVTDDPVFVNGVNQFTVLVYQANRNGGQISSTCDVMGSASWDGGWNGSATTLSITTDQECYGVWVQFVFNNVPNSYFLVSNIAIA